MKWYDGKPRIRRSNINGVIQYHAKTWPYMTLSANSIKELLKVWYASARAHQRCTTSYVG